MKIFVSNVPFDSTDQDLASLFRSYGQVDSAKIICDRDSGRSRGIAFVDMPNQDEAEQAIAYIPREPYMGRIMRLEQAREREKRPDYGRGNSGGRGDREYSRNQKGGRDRRERY